jgi:hypothetical protein
MSDQLERLLADLELELSEIDAELKAIRVRVAELVLRKMDVINAIEGIKHTNGAD